MMAQACCRALLRRAGMWNTGAASVLQWVPAAAMSQHHSAMASHGDGSTRWRYAADDAVRKMAARVEKGDFSNTCGVTLNAARPLSPDVFKEAAVHLSRKVEQLQMCLRQRDGHLWVTEMETPKIDFEVVEDGQLEDLVKVTAGAAYNMAEGPLWRARLLVCPPDEPCRMARVKDAFPHQYHFAIDLHHSLHDGVSVMAAMQLYFKILDQLLDGANIDDKQIGEVRDRREARAAEAKIAEALKKDPQRLKVRLQEHIKIKTRVPLITEAFGIPEEPSPSTLFAKWEILDGKLVQAFHDKCKEHKVSFNSGFSCVLHVALLELLHEAGMIRDSYTISTRYAVDTRRYMSDVTTMVWGYYAMPMTQTMTAARNMRKDFWKFAQDFDTKFVTQVNKMAPLEERVLDTMMESQNPDDKRKAIYDLGFTKLFSARTKSFGSGKLVQMTNILNYTHLTRLDYRMGCVLSIVQGHLQLILLHSTDYITKENAAKFFDKVINAFNDIAESVE